MYTVYIRMYKWGGVAGGVAKPSTDADNINVDSIEVFTYGKSWNQLCLKTLPRSGGGSDGLVMYYVVGITEETFIAHIDNAKRMSEIYKKAVILDLTGSVPKINMLEVPRV